MREPIPPRGVRHQYSCATVIKLSDFGERMKMNIPTCAFGDEVQEGGFSRADGIEVPQCWKSR
jgi:hypothetical protein